MGYLRTLRMHEFVVVCLSEIIFNKIKLKSMKATISKISIHMIVSCLLTHLECLMFYVGGQTIPLGRFEPTRDSCKPVERLFN